MAASPKVGLKVGALVDLYHDCSCSTLGGLNDGSFSTPHGTSAARVYQTPPSDNSWTTAKGIVFSEKRVVPPDYVRTYDETHIPMPEDTRLGYSTSPTARRASIQVKETQGTTADVGINGYAVATCSNLSDGLVVGSSGIRLSRTPAMMAQHSTRCFNVSEAVDVLSTRTEKCPLADTTSDAIETKPGIHHDSKDRPDSMPSVGSESRLDADPAIHENYRIDASSSVSGSLHTPNSVVMSSQAENLHKEEDENEGSLLGISESISDVERLEEDHIPLSYQIPTETLREKMQASPRVEDRFWNHTLYRGPCDERLLVHYCKTFDVAEHVAKYFLREKVLGFDIEWKPFARADSIAENVSLIQIACENRIALFHVALFEGNTPEELLPPSLKAIIESQEIVKVGVAIKADFTRLQKYLNTEPLGVFELSRLHNLIEYATTDPQKSVSKKQVGLAAQVQQHLQLPLAKGDVRHSDWSKRLNSAQVDYAAADAYAGFRIFDILEAKRKLLLPIPPRPQLCDFDPKPASKASRRRRTHKKRTKQEDAISSQALEVEVEEEEVDEEDYETAVEDFSDREGNESVSKSGLPQGSFEKDIVDGDYMRDDSHRLEPSMDSQAEALSTLTHSDVMYPQLPDLSDLSNELTSRVAFDPSISQFRPLLTQEIEDFMLQPESNGRHLADEEKDVEVHTDDESTLDVNLSQETAINQTRLGQPKSSLTPALDFKPLSPTADDMTHTAEYRSAEKWAQAYLLRTIPSPFSTTTSCIRATVPPLRAYHLWYHQQLPLDDVSRHLRDPPLAMSTVCNYILQAISLEKLDYRSEDMKEVLRGLPPGLRMTRWKWLVDRLGGL